MRFLSLTILIMFSSAVYASEPATIYYTTNGSEPTYQIDPIQTILDANPPCFEWARKYDEYSRMALDRDGLEWRLHRWTCVLTGEIGWTPEPTGVKQ